MFNGRINRGRRGRKTVSKQAQQLLDDILRVGGVDALRAFRRKCRVSRGSELADGDSDWEISNAFIWAKTPEGHEYWCYTNKAIEGLH